jgi:hypothetical protein
MNPNRNKVIAALLATGALSIAPVAHGAIIASYDFTSDSNSTVTEPNSGALAFAYSSSETGRSSAGNAFVRARATGVNQDAALADEDFVSFTVNALSGYQLNLLTLTFDFGGSSGSAYISSMLVQSSVGGFGDGNPILFEESHSVPSSAASGSFDAGNSINLSAAQFQGLSTVTFQFRFYDTVTSTTTLTEVNRLDNVVLEGTVTAVPEPTSLAMAGLGAGALLTRRRAKWICAV